MIHASDRIVSFLNKNFRRRQKSKFYILHVILYTSQIVPIALLQLCLQHLHRQDVLSWTQIWHFYNNLYAAVNGHLETTLLKARWRLDMIWT